MGDKKHAGGRTPTHKKEFAEQAKKLCLLGATDESLADFFGVSTTSIYNWKNAHPEFVEALKEGKDIADATVRVFYCLLSVNSLYQLNFPLSIGLGYHIDSASGAC